MKRYIKLTAIACVAAMALQMTACSFTEPAPASGESKKEEPAGTQEAVPAVAEALEETVKIAVIVKGMNSEFWQTVIAGAKKSGQDLGNVEITSYGPPSEANMDEQVTILEDVISKKPNAIVIASTSKEATVPALEKAYADGIKIILIDGSIDSDSYDTFLATDNEKGGAMAADTFVAKLEEEGKELKGKIGILSAMAGVQSLTARNDGFITRLKEIAPDITIADTKYSNGDIMKAVTAAEDMLTANADLIGFYADNNECGSAAAQVIAERGRENELAAVAFDADESEIEALKTGALDGIVLQDPYGMGYKAVASAVDALNGKTLEKYIDTGVKVATKENMDDEDIHSLLYPQLD